jgi:hypothetical protein
MSKQENENNPFQTPEFDSHSVKQPFKQRPNGLDLFIGILLGVLASILLFPVSCIGAVLVTVETGIVDWHESVIWIVMLLCLVVSVVAGYLVTSSFVRRF